MPGIDPQLSDFTYSTTNTLTQDLNHPRRRVLGGSYSSRGSRDTSPCNEVPVRRNSAFLEVGLGGEDAIIDTKLRRDFSPKLQVRFQNKVDVVEPETIDLSATSPADTLPRPQMSPYFPTLPRLLLLALVIVLIAPNLHSSPPLIAEANPVPLKAGSPGSPESLRGIKRAALPEETKRDDTQTVVCKRWAGQSAVVNGTLYYYGGRATTSADQSSNEWSMSYP